MSARAQRYLAEIGITVYERRREHDAAASVADGARVAAVARATAPSPAAGEAENEVWEQLAAEVRACTRCGLHKTRTQTVFGVGRRDAELLVIGEAPGADEDRQGEPFVGRAGLLLNAMLRAIGLPRSEVYIANILKCRPPGNRDPQPEEASTCTPYLSRQIALVRPRAILAVGRIAAQWLLQSDAPIGRLRGRVFHYGESGTPLIVTYHPAYLLRSPLVKATAWTDLCMVKDLLQRRA
ncbi:MAG TPA: uracil-DNA glycosylase [Gammaproteobacteria bacterium]|nr:uracil-DNA glycosylase [Gammaproteobacteria bacterium]